MDYIVIKEDGSDNYSLKGFEKLIPGWVTFQEILKSRNPQETGFCIL